MLNTGALMRILSHRGLWTDRSEHNSPQALARSFREGFGVETDIRDHRGRLVLAHGLPGDGGPDFHEVLAQLSSISTALPLALNVKADGLQELLRESLVSLPRLDYFLFDASVPDMLVSMRRGLRVFTRQSEYERECPLYADAAGVWIDCFEREWVDDGDIAAHLASGKQVCLVSPELHGRDHVPFWHRLRAMRSAASRDVMLCTDFPLQARGFHVQD